MSGPCSVWQLDETCSDIPDGTDQALIDSKQAIATRLLWAGSGRRVGPCEITVRPCLQTCGGLWSPFASFTSFDGPSMLPLPFIDPNGDWQNFCGCASDCSCSRLCTIVLPGPVASISQVLIGGDELEEQNYRLDLIAGRWELVRTDSGCWPACQDMRLDITEENTFAVVYELGIPLDELAIAAVTELTSELVKACLPECKTCRLPKNATVVVRRGVTITLDLLQAWFAVLPMVKAFLQSANPNGLMSQSRIFTPDLQEFRQTVEPAGS